MIITAERRGEQLRWSDLWTRFPARTGSFTLPMPFGH